MMSIGLLGAGAQAREIASYLTRSDGVSFCAVDAGTDVETRHRVIDISRPEPADAETAVVAAIGAPAIRRRLVASWPGELFAIVQSAAAYVGPDCELAPGVVVAPHAVLTTNVTVGPHTVVNIGAMISHDVVCGAFVTIGPGANVAGNVVLGDGVFIGAGATVSNRVSLASGTVVGAGSVVLHDVTVPNSVVVGSPARSIYVNQDWLDAV